MSEKSQITVTSPLLPPLEEFNSYLQQIWDSKWITNNGHFHQQLEQALAEYLGVEYLSLFTNGTLPLITAFQALGIHEGEVITTPYSFVATSHSIWWNGLKPVFVDIEEDTCGIDPSKIEAAITPNTVAIMPVHCYGKSCKTAEIDAIAKKHNLKVPETYDELYAVCKELKKLYPDSYPFCTRSMSYLFDIPGSSFDKWWQYGAYYDFDDEEWRWGATEDTALEVVTFYKKMIDEKLMPSDSVTLNNATWEEFMLTDKGFILPHLQLRIDYFNQLAHQGGNTEYKLQAFAPPVANAEKGASMIERGDLEMIGFSIPDSGREEGIANAAKFLDWMYTDEAMELVSWGKEGETYEVVDGKKKYITDENGTQPNTMYGFQLYGTFCRLDPSAAEALQSETTIESEKLIVEHTLPEYPVTLWLDFNDEEQSVIDMYRTGLHTYTEEMLIKFMLGQEPLANFDKFVENLKSMGVDEVIAAYESAYSRVK